jgi:predicted ArsR family transcriptional regulator
MNGQTPAVTDPLRNVDRELLEAIRALVGVRSESVGIGDLTERLGVTATAVRQRVERLLAQGLIEREKMVRGRGRPTYQYRLTVEGHRRSGANPTEIADAMWREIMAIPDPQTRDQLLSAVATRMGRKYAAEILADKSAGSFAQRMTRLSQLMASRHVAVEVSNFGELPVLDICSCPYPTLTDSSEQRAMCHLEEQMISEALGHPVQLTSCCLDGDASCQFTAAASGSS